MNLENVTKNATKCKKLKNGEKKGHSCLISDSFFSVENQCVGARKEERREVGTQTEEQKKQNKTRKSNENRTTTMKNKFANMF